MTEAEFNTYLLYTSYLCIILAAFNLFRYRKRGVRAMIMASAFLVMAALLQLMRNGSPQPWFAIALVILFLLLVADVVVKMRRTPEELSK